MSILTAILPFIKEIILPFVVDIIKEFFTVKLKETVTHADSTDNPTYDAYLSPYRL
jgi:hypothetical protein